MERYVTINVAPDKWEQLKQEYVAQKLYLNNVCQDYQKGPYAQAFVDVCNRIFGADKMTDDNPFASFLTD